jgi:putative amide transporter protein
MLLGVMLLYVGAVLVVNGIWLLGQARAAEVQPARRPSEGGVEAAGGPGEGAAVAVATVETHPVFIENREVAILNVFTGFVGVVTAGTLLVQGNQDGDLASIRGGGYILLFAFTYLWVAYNQFANAGGHAFGWYCLFVAVTAVAAGIFTFDNAEGNDASIYLGIDWFAWAVLWFMFFLLLALERPIAKITGWAAILVGIGTSWVFAILLLEGQLAF